MGGDPWSRGGPYGISDGWSQPHGMHQHHMIPIPGHASPDFSFHEQLSGAASPYTLPHHGSFPMSHHPAQHPGGYPHQAPVIHHPGAAPPPSSRPRAKSKEEYGARGAQYNRRPSPSLSSPMKQQQQQQQYASPGERKIRSRKDSAASVTSTLSGGDDQGGISFGQTVSSPNSSSASVLRQALPGLNTSTSSDEGLAHSDWFYPSSQDANLSYSTLDSAGSRGATSKQQLTMTPSGRSHGTGRSLDSTRIPAGERKSQHQQPQGGKKPLQKQQKERQAPPHLDLSRTKAGGVRAAGSSYHGDGDADDKQARGEFVIESPTERQAFKEFGKQFRQKENESLAAARDYALACLSESNRDIFLPPATHWRVYLELADVAKRSNQIHEARSYYRRACELQPHASQGWLEHSKLEEESGELRHCARIMREGLENCPSNENLLIRAVKFYERMGDLGQARQLLSRLKYLSIEKSWKTMLEGALLEARAGRYTMAREVLKFLTHNVPWYGPLYLAHTKLERDYGTPAEAFLIVEKGLKELPRYGPLYFQAFRLLEKEDLSQKQYDLPRTMEMVSRADNISRELLWKVHLEAAQMQERAAALKVEENPKRLDLKVALQATRRSYAKAIMLCPPNLSWKVWLASGRTEVSCDNTKGARELFLRAHDSVSEKGRSTVLLECARLEEYCGSLSLSRSILCKARQQFGKSDWKVWLSSVNLESRCGLRERAIAFAQEALNIHRGTGEHLAIQLCITNPRCLSSNPPCTKILHEGRLWAALIQLRHDDGESLQTKVLKCALQAVPKSGEVWCEGEICRPNVTVNLSDTS